MLVVLIGKSSSGKDMVSRELVNKYNYRKIIRYTTRPLRKGEKNGDTYHYISKEDFLLKVNNNFFIEWKGYDTVDGIWYYGTAWEDIEDISSRTVIILPPDRYEEVVKNTSNKFISIYIYANNETLKKRLNKRGDNKDEAKRRIEHDNEDFRGVEQIVDRIVYNNDGTNIDDVVKKILEFVGER